MKVHLTALLFLCALVPAGEATAQTTDSQEVAACRATGLVALRERSPSVRDIMLDMDTLTVSKANTKIEDTPVHTIIMGEVYLERKEAGKSQRFLCLVGKVLLTFFTAR